MQGASFDCERCSCDEVKKNCGSETTLTTVVGTIAGGDEFILIRDALAILRLRKAPPMTTERSDKLYATWRDSTEKFDYFILGVTGALCAFISQTYKPVKIGINAGTLEVIALLILVLAVVAGFRRLEKTLLITAINHQELHAYEARGGMVANLKPDQQILNQATGQVFSPEAATKRIAELTESIEQLQRQVAPIQQVAERHYHARNYLTLIGFLLVVAAKVWSAYP